MHTFELLFCGFHVYPYKNYYTINTIVLGYKMMLLSSGRFLVSMYSYKEEILNFTTYILCKQLVIIRWDTQINTAYR